MKVWKFSLWLDPFVQSKPYLCHLTLKSDAKFEEKLTLGSKDDMRNLVNFNSWGGKSGNLHFDVLFLPMLQRWIISHDTEKRSKVWQKTDFLFEKWHWWTLNWAVESLKTCTLMSYFCRKYVMFELKRYRGVMLWKKTYGFKNDISNFVNLHTSSWK